VFLEFINNGKWQFDVKIFKKYSENFALVNIKIKYFPNNYDGSICAYIKAVLKRNVCCVNEGNFECNNKKMYLWIICSKS